MVAEHWILDPDVREEDEDAAVLETDIVNTSCIDGLILSQ